MRRALPNLDRLAARVAAAWRPGDGAAALVRALAPARVLEIGSSRGETAAGALARVRQWVAIDPDAASVAAARTRLAGAAADVRWFHAALRPATGGARHFTRDAALVGLLCEGGFDCVLVDATASADALYTDLAHALPLLEQAGVVVCRSAAGEPAAAQAVRRIASEGSCRAVRWRSPDGAIDTAFLALRATYRTHEETTELRRVVAGDVPAIADAFARGQHHAVVGRLRHWLAERLVWSTSDLLLPLGALPPPISVLDVVEQGALGEGGVDAPGAAVTLAMLYRAFGYPATVYTYGVPGVWTHAVTLVGVSGHGLLVEDALLDVEPMEGERPVPWAELVTRTRAGDALARVRLAHGGVATRPHLYSRASLAGAEATGWIGGAERAALLDAMGTAERVLGEARAAVTQAVTCSPAAFTALPAHAAALGAIAERIGVAHPLALLALPYGNLPLTGARRYDDEMGRVFGAAALGAAREAGAEAAR